MTKVRIIDADEIRKKAVPHTRGDYGYNANIRKWAVLVGDIDDAPTVDAVCVTRCKDCKYIRPEVDAYTQEVVGCWCSLLDLGSVEDEHFCSYGARMDGE